MTPALVAMTLSVGDIVFFGRGFRSASMPGLASFCFGKGGFGSL
jgi:hypothetical protein